VSRPRGGVTGALPPPPLTDLVEGLPSWPDLDPTELATELARSESLSAGLTEAAAARLAAAGVAGAAAARLALDGRLRAVRGDELVAWAAAEARLPEDEARVHVFLRALLDVLASAPSAVRTVDGLLGALAALAPADGVRLDVAGTSFGAPIGEVGRDPLELPVPGANAVLLVRPAIGADARCRVFAEETARLLATSVRSRGRRSSGELAKLEAAQRRLRRLALDLHDGPAQDVAALAADAALLVAELGDSLSDARRRVAQELAVEIRDRLSALGRDVRDLAEVLEPRAMLRESIRDVLVRESASFARRSGVTPTVEVDDDLGVMTASQQIALVRVAQEALTNVREHSEATEVRLTARVTAQGVSLVIADNGRGFDVARAPTRGRLGLAGMDERVRLLGGRLTIESRPGGPTRVEATIPRWRPSA